MCVCVWSEELSWPGKLSREAASSLKCFLPAVIGDKFPETASTFKGMMMMKKKRTLCRISCLVTLIVELSWINVGDSTHREGASRVSVA